MGKSNRIFVYTFPTVTHLIYVLRKKTTNNRRILSDAILYMGVYVETSYGVYSVLEKYNTQQYDEIHLSVIL